MEWEKPKTTRMYVQPPKSENLFVLFREGKILFGKNENKIRNQYFDITSTAIEFFCGNDKEINIFNTKFNMRDDGIPIHTLINTIGNFEFELQIFSSFEKRSTCFFKVTLTNHKTLPTTELFSFVIKTALEKNLVDGAPDIYKRYSGSLNNILSLPSNWTGANNVYTYNGEYLRIKGRSKFERPDKMGRISKSISLNPGESVTFYFSFGNNDMDFDYDYEKNKALKCWKGELAKINKLPKTIEKNPSLKKIIYNLVVQMLQCFCYQTETGKLLSRQGGLQRQIWVYESMPVLESLMRVGDFSDYVEPVINSYFEDFFSETGEIKPLAIPWASSTANAIRSFAVYAREAGEKYYNHYIDRVYRSFLWIKNTRASVKDDKNVVGGLFPPLRSCDDPLVFQSWSGTDVFNLMALNELYLTSLKFHDPRSKEIKAEYEDYLLIIRREWENYEKCFGNTDELEFRHTPRIPNELIDQKFEFSPRISYFVYAVDLPIDSAMKLINYYTRRNSFCGGLYDRMPNKSDAESSKFNLDNQGNSVVYYVCSQEYYWFLYFSKHKAFKDKLKPIVEDNFKYAMSDEFYMVERYNKNDPYFTPWSPNASNNGRTVIMMLDYYGRPEEER